MVSPEWEIREPVDADEVHVVPTDDIWRHWPNCMCGPTTEAVPRDDGSYGWLVTHTALDGRE